MSRDVRSEGGEDETAVVVIRTVGYEYPSSVFTNLCRNRNGTEAYDDDEEEEETEDCLIALLCHICLFFF